MQKLFEPTRQVKSRFEDQVMMYFRIVIIFGVMFLAIAYLAGAQEEAKADIEANYGNVSVAYNVSNLGLEETQNLTERSGTISSVVIAALVITILLAAFFGVFALVQSRKN